ncbi:MAG: hypothetical protein KDB53_04440 [Planctomycetes bacterium]|nr:hypothetical protein [Planctomycetota bacterium]
MTPRQITVFAISSAFLVCLGGCGKSRTPAGIILDQLSVTVMGITSTNWDGDALTTGEALYGDIYDSGGLVASVTVVAVEPQTVAFSVPPLAVGEYHYRIGNASFLGSGLLTVAASLPVDDAADLVASTLRDLDVRIDALQADLSNRGVSQTGVKSLLAGAYTASVMAQSLLATSTSLEIEAAARFIVANESPRTSLASRPLTRATELCSVSVLDAREHALAAAIGLGAGLGLAAQIHGEQDLPLTPHLATDWGFRRSD